MRFLVTSDIHLTDNPAHEYRWEFLDWLDNLAEKDQVSTIFILGDLSQDKDNHSSVLVNRIHDRLLKLAEKRNLCILKGNHDHPDGGVPYWKFLSSIPNLTYVDEGTVVNVDGSKFLLLPHTKHPKKDWGDLDFKQYDFVFFHQTLPGSVSSSGQRLTGDDLPLLPEGPIYIAGDIHTPSSIYVGSPYDTRFGDHIDGRVLEWDGEKLISIPAPRYQLRAVDLELEDEDHWEEQIVANNFGTGVFRFRVHVPTSHISERHAIKKRLSDLCSRLHLKVDSILMVNMDTDSIQKTMERPDILSFNPASILSQYASHQGIDDPVYLKRGLGLIELFGGQ